MPRYISICSLEQKYFITGEVVVLINHNLEIANPQFCLDLVTAKKSLQGIIEIESDFYSYICY